MCSTTATLFYVLSSSVSCTSHVFFSQAADKVDESVSPHILSGKEATVGQVQHRVVSFNAGSNGISK